MNNEEMKQPDEFFKHGLESFEVPYSEAAWGDMRNLLDKADRKRPFLLWFQKNKKQTLTLITITMIATTLISVFYLFNTGQVDNPVNKQPMSPIQSTGETSGLMNPNSGTPQKQEHSSVNSSAYTDYQESVNSEKTEIPAETEFKEGVNAVHKTEKTEPAATEQLNSGIVNSAQEKLTFPAADNAETTVSEEKPEPIISKPESLDESQPMAVKNVSDIQKNNLENPLKPSGYTTFRGPWMGIHFTAQQAAPAMGLNSYTDHFGFNFQFMSPNLTGRKDFGGHLGVDFGALWYGRGKHYGVVLNNSSLDSGFTRLSTHSFDIFARGHFEYARFRIKPYVNAVAGPRIYATSQYVKSYHPKTDYENSSNTNVANSVSFMYGAAIGARIAVSKHVSIDGRWEFLMGTQTQTTDLEASEFNGISSFSLKKNIITPEYSQWKFGVLFDLWNSYESSTTHTNNDVVQTNEYYYFDSSANQYIKVNCRCTEKPVGSDTTKKYHGPYPDKNAMDFDEGGSSKIPEPSRTKGSGINIPSGGSGSSGSSKGSFPGIKSGGGGGGVKIKH